MTEAAAEVPPPGRLRRAVGSHRTVGFAMAIGGALLFSVNGSVSKLALQSGIDSLSLVLLRSAGAAVVLFLLVLATDRSRLRLSKLELPMLLLYGVVGIALVQWFYFVAIARLPVGVALLLEFTGPVLVALWVHVVQGQRLGRSLWLAASLALGGLALVAEIWSGLEFDVVGVLAGFGAAVSLATYYVAGKNMLSGRDTVSVAFWAFVIAALFWSVVRPWWNVPWSTLGADVTLPGSLDVTTSVSVLVAWIVLLGTVAPFLLVVGALRRLPTAEAGVIGMIEPVLAGAVAWVWLDEALSGVQVLGSLVVIAGILVAQRATQT
ncbi:MAG TPA: DMT family transporter [Actinomycetes bacterium]|nr:DMT family transporter [Actinomycetes bacterium]